MTETCAAVSATQPDTGLGWGSESRKEQMWEQQELEYPHLMSEPESEYRLLPELQWVHPEPLPIVPPVQQPKHLPLRCLKNPKLLFYLPLSHLCFLSENLSDWD